jgi:predicted nucleic acid-binding protein
MSDDRYFVDTNVLLYSLDNDAPLKRRRATAWIDFLWDSNAAGLSWQVLNEFYWNATRKMGVQPGEARRIARQLTGWQPLGMDLEIIERSWYWIDSAQLSYWDGLILASAEKLGCSVLLTEDLQSNRSYGSVRVLNPFEQAPPSHEMLH